MYSITKQFINDLEVSIISVKRDLIQFSCMNYGATILDIIVPDKNGIMENVVMKYHDLNSYDHDEMYLNAIIGPTSGRIKDAEFTLGKTNYSLDKNFIHTHNIHGGEESFAFQLFEYQVEELDEETNIIFTFFKDANYSRYPGDQNIKITYKITDTALEIDFFGTTNQDTLLNMTNHAYFNLSGNMKKSILDHVLYVNASRYLSLDSEFIPTDLVSTKNTFLDFLTPTLIKDNMTAEVRKLPTKGIDHPFILDDSDYTVVQAKLTDEQSKRSLSVYTTYPSIVIYTHNFPDGLKLEHNMPQVSQMGICFETQFEPNGIHVPNAHQAILLKDQVYHQKTLYQFSVEE
ncbi:MAG: galactose mutarotase [Firmicutes bacterium]|nr:galactose mutarotase [Bacillota bacterium]